MSKKNKKEEKKAHKSKKDKSKVKKDKPAKKKKDKKQKTPSKELQVQTQAQAPPVHPNDKILNKKRDEYTLRHGIKATFQRKEVSIMLSLPPASLSNTKKAMHDSMQSMLLKYSDGLGGVLLSFDDVQIDESKNGGKYGRILNEMPHIHYFITCNVLIFNPSVGMAMVGVVNESFPSHVGLLVHELFNAMVSAEALNERGFHFDAALNEWSRDGDEKGPIAEGDCMHFTVEQLNECNGLISLEGKSPIIVDSLI